MTSLGREKDVDLNGGLLLLTGRMAFVLLGELARPVRLPSPEVEVVTPAPHAARPKKHPHPGTIILRGSFVKPIYLCFIISLTPFSRRFKISPFECVG